MSAQVCILGGGNIGMAIARGLVASHQFEAKNISITKRHEKSLTSLKEEGFAATTDNLAAVRNAKFVLLCVQPSQIQALVEEISPALKAKQQVLISVATGVSTEVIRAACSDVAPVIRAMPNTAILLGESMTCISTEGVEESVVKECTELFDLLGTTLVIDEDQMTPATALCACGIAFFLRAIRAASQGGIEIGFHADDALAMAAQTARGAASLLLQSGRHPEGEIDRVTTPMGCTIAGLNQMEHEGFSSALIRGIVTSANKASKLGQD